MKTISLGKIDLYTQYFLACINTCAIIAVAFNTDFFGPLLLIQIFINLYHFFTNMVHLNANHRSVGFAQYRSYYQTLSLVYVPVGFILTLAFLGSLAFFIITWLIIPQIVLHAYIYLCKKELDFIEQREFHILK